MIKRVLRFQIRQNVKNLPGSGSTTLAQFYSRSIALQLSPVQANQEFTIKVQDQGEDPIFGLFCLKSNLTVYRSYLGKVRFSRKLASVLTIPLQRVSISKKLEAKLSTLKFCQNVFLGQRKFHCHYQTCRQVFIDKFCMYHTNLDRGVKSFSIAGSIM